jgi:hypothetical protein
VLSRLYVGRVQMLSASNSTAARPNIRTASAIQSYSSQKRIMTALHCRSFPTTAAQPHAVGESLAAPSISVNGLRVLSTCLVTSIRQRQGFRFRWVRIRLGAVGHLGTRMTGPCSIWLTSMHFLNESALVPCSGYADGVILASVRSSRPEGSQRLP